MALGNIWAPDFHSPERAILVPCLPMSPRRMETRRDAGGMAASLPIKPQTGATAFLPHKLIAFTKARDDLDLPERAVGLAPG